MKFLKKYWYFIIITLVTAGLGIMTFITSQQLTKKTPVAPNVAQQKPKAAVAACTLTITLATTGSPTATPTNTPTNTPTSTPTNTPTPTTIYSSTSTPTPTTIYSSTSTPTPLPLASCNNGCTINADCRSGLICDGGSCRNANCTEKTNCTCDIAATVAPTPKTPVAGTGPSILGASVIGGAFLLILLGLAL